MAAGGSSCSEDSNSLRHILWQRAVFKEGKTARSVADALRLRLHLLEISNKDKSSLCHQQLIETNLKKYGKIIDCQSSESGMNNFAESIQSLVGNSKNCSKDWQSSPDVVDSILHMTEFESLSSDPPKCSDDPFPILKSVQKVTITEPSTVTPITDSQSLPPPVSMATTSQPSLPNNTPISKFQYSIPPQSNTTSTTSASTGTLAGINTSTGTVASTLAGTTITSHSTSNTSKMDGNKYPGNNGYNSRYNGSSRKRKRFGRFDEDNDETEESCEQNSGHGFKGKSSFITAKDQHKINQYKKANGRGQPHPSEDIYEDDYGNNKRSLGTRRTAGSRFVPPVKKPNEDDEQDINEKIRSRVLYSKGGSGSSDGNGTLPPELEGDERLRNIEPRMVELIMNEIMDHGAPVQWEDIAGLEYAKTTIKEIVVWPMLRPDIFKGLRGPPKGILLFGPPGTGKTLIGKCIASQVQATFFSISASSLTSKWVGEGEKMVRALFAVSRCYQPAVIFIDEIDSLLSQRSDSEHESSRRIKTEFLVQLDGATTSDEDKLLVVGATNRPQEIDEAARRRLVKRLYIPLPDSPARKQIVSNLLRDQAYELTEQEMDSICDKTDGYSGADMSNLCREAALGPIRDAAHDIQNIAVDQVRPVLYRDFTQALDSIRPSVSESDLELYVTWNSKYGCNSKR